MATEENEPGLYGALYNAMTEPKLIDNLLRHPEFIRRARMICNKIAGPARSEDLLQEVCLRVLERVSQLNPNNIRNEGEFFGWFFQLARRVHLSRTWSVAAVSSCTEKVVGWPDSPTDVPPDEMERFLAHANACPYHTRLLHAEDEKVRAIFRRARGLDSQGRLLRGAELHTSITEHKRRLQNWRETAFKGRLFGQVALFNGGKKILSCGKFYDFSIHISRNELNPSAGLQICAVTGNPDEDVLLGFYALAGVRHKGKEKILKLDNGYTVGLKVKQVSETTFDIHFRCVETKTPEAKRVAAEDSAAAGVVIEKTDDERLSLSGGLTPPVVFPPNTPVPPASAGLWPLPQGWQTAAMFALMVVVVAVPCIWVGKKLGREAARDESVKQEKKSQTTPLPPVQRPSWINEELTVRADINPQHPDSRGQFKRQKAQWQRRGFNAFVKVRRSSVGNQAATGVGRSNLVEAAEAAQYRQPAVPLINNDPPSVLMERWLTSGDVGRGMPVSQMDSMPKIQHVSARIYDSKSEIRPAPGVIPGEILIPKPSSTGVVDRRSASAQVLSYEERNASSVISVLHSAPNDALLSRVSAALQRQHSRVEPLAEQQSATASFRVRWAARESSWREGALVELNAYVFRNGETNAVYQRSYEVAGVSLDDAYDEALRKTVKEVIDWIRESERRHSPSATESGMELRADASKEEIGEDRDGEGICPNRTEVRPGQILAEKNAENGSKRLQKTEDR